MSADTPQKDNGSDDIREVERALSSQVGLRALANHVRRHPQFFEFLWKLRFWWVLASVITFVLPVLRNNNTAALNYSHSSTLYGFDLLVPMLSRWSDNSISYVSSVSINPMALVIYGLAGLHLYLCFVQARVSPRLTCWHGAIQTILILLFPVLDIAVLTFILRGFDSYWHMQPPLFGFWVLLVSGLALWGGGYGQIVKAAPYDIPPPLK